MPALLVGLFSTEEGQGSCQECEDCHDHIGKSVWILPQPRDDIFASKRGARSKHGRILRYRILKQTTEQWSDNYAYVEGDGHEKESLRLISLVIHNLRYHSPHNADISIHRTANATVDQCPVERLRETKANNRRE